MAFVTSAEKASATPAPAEATVTMTVTVDGDVHGKSLTDKDCPSDYVITFRGRNAILNRGRVSVSCYFDTVADGELAGERLAAAMTATVTATVRATKDGWLRGSVEAGGLIIGDADDDGEDAVDA